MTRHRIKLVWTPLNVSLLILLTATALYFAVRQMTVDPQTDLMLSLANSVYRV